MIRPYLNSRCSIGIAKSDIQNLCIQPLRQIMHQRQGLRGWINQKILGLGVGIVKPWRAGRDTDIEDRSWSQASAIKSGHQSVETRDNGIGIDPKPKMGESAIYRSL